MPVPNIATPPRSFSPASAGNNAELEIQAFARVIQRLEAAEPKNKMSLILALDENWRLWACIQSQVMSADNMLPVERRARLVSLSFWMERHTEAVLSGLAEIQGIIDVNRLVVSGLEMQVERQTAIPVAA